MVLSAFARHNTSRSETNYDGNISLGAFVNVVRISGPKNL